MNGVYWAALGIGGSTLLGTACGFLFSRVTNAWNSAVTAFAAGVMLSAAAFGLFVPAMDMASGAGVLLLAAGAACGVLFLRAVGTLSARIGGDRALLSRHPELLFVMAIAVHKFPEGMAGGISLSGMNPGAALTMVIGISLQNLPEGVVMIPPLMAAGVRRSCAAGIALATGILNAAGVFAGALWGRLSGGILPFALAFAGAAMLDVIVSGMVVQLHTSGRMRSGALILLGGFVLMASINAVCG